MRKQDSTTTPQHTPTPWTWETYDGDERVFIYTCDSATGLESKPIILRGPDKITNVERAALIVRAVNAYEPMREALRVALAEIEAYDLHPDGLAEQLRAALALAEKDPDDSCPNGKCSEPGHLHNNAECPTPQGLEDWREER